SGPIVPESSQTVESSLSTAADPPSLVPERPALFPAVQAWSSSPAAEFIFYLWLGAVLAMALVQAVRLIRLRCLLATGRTAPRSLTELVADLAGHLGIRPPATIIVPGLASPMVWGLGRPTLLWPASLRGLSLECTRAV